MKKRRKKGVSDNARSRAAGASTHKPTGPEMSPSRIRRFWSWIRRFGGWIIAGMTLLALVVELLDLFPSVSIQRIVAMSEANPTVFRIELRNDCRLFPIVPTSVHLIAEDITLPNKGISLRGNVISNSLTNQGELGGYESTTIDVPNSIVPPDHFVEGARVTVGLGYVAFGVGGWKTAQRFEFRRTREGSGVWSPLSGGSEVLAEQLGRQEEAQTELRTRMQELESRVHELTNRLEGSPAGAK